jgi:hypothetical protein
LQSEGVSWVFLFYTVALRTGHYGVPREPPLNDLRRN